MGDKSRAGQRTRRKSKRAVAEGDEWAVEGGGPNAIQQMYHSLGLHRSETTDTSADPLADHHQQQVIAYGRPPQPHDPAGWLAEGGWDGGPGLAYGRNRWGLGKASNSLCGVGGGGKDPFRTDSEGALVQKKPKKPRAKMSRDASGMRFQLGEAGRNELKRRISQKLKEEPHWKAIIPTGQIKLATITKLLEMAETLGLTGEVHRIYSRRCRETQGPPQPPKPRRSSRDRVKSPLLPSSQAALHPLHPLVSLLQCDDNISDDTSQPSIATTLPKRRKFDITECMAADMGDEMDELQQPMGGGKETAGAAHSQFHSASKDEEDPYGAYYAAGAAAAAAACGVAPPPMPQPIHPDPRPLIFIPRRKDVGGTNIDHDAKEGTDSHQPQTAAAPAAAAAAADGGGGGDGGGMCDGDGEGMETADDHDSHGVPAEPAGPPPGLSQEGKQ
mmetsp:Transcript_9285/g.26799  ORF Transcript_9285/g.26799 Transcript_9285/m.26799 type:complete len:444 (+) Transcript_9285:3-1334(+)